MIKLILEPFNIVIMNIKTMEKVETLKQYQVVRQEMERLIKEATEKNLLELDLDNDYIREIGRLSRLNAQFESEKMEFKYLKVRSKSPLIKEIEDIMYNRHLRQKDLAEILEVNEPTLSQIMTGKRTVSMRMAKRMYNTLQIDPKLILEFA
jgi:antitoxin component HigA of HigAB toxin-antitoxin module